MKPEYLKATSTSSQIGTHLHVVPVGSHEAFLEGGPALQRRLALLELHVLPQQGCSPCLHMFPSPLRTLRETSGMRSSHPTCCDDSAGRLC